MNGKPSKGQSGIDKGKKTIEHTRGVHQQVVIAVFEMSKVHKVEEDGFGDEMK